MALPLQGFSSLTLGMMVRAYRLGFGWVGERNCFMRIQGDGPFRVELRPIELIPNVLRSDEPHWVWWARDEQGGRGFNPLGIYTVRSLKVLKKPLSFVMDDNGFAI